MQCSELVVSERARRPSVPANSAGATSAAGAPETNPGALNRSSPSTNRLLKSGRAPTSPPNTASNANARFAVCLTAPEEKCARWSMDTAGAAVLRLALDRGARVALVMPRTPNVYRDANAKALKRLMDEHGNFCDVSESETLTPPGAFEPLTRRDETDFFSRLFYDVEESGGTVVNLEPGKPGEEPRGGLTAFVCDDMLHAKVFLARARDKSVPSACMIGSCNLKQRSFGQFAELNALITQPSLAKQLERELTLVASQSERVCARDADALRYAEPRATIEEWLG